MRRRKKSGTAIFQFAASPIAIIPLSDDKAGKKEFVVPEKEIPTSCRTNARTLDDERAFLYRSTAPRLTFEVTG